ncbi:MAG: SDR family NAD(P)-dependent oxidoreductase [Candidatus Protochlamydia sp.]|nr:SDR family NAD(P)-dependent oxidoreductase [Candidatus Protochlamydia sp.]
MSKKLIGKVAIVTGGSKGIGASIAEELAKEGASVVINYSSSNEEADRVVRNIKRSGGNSIAIQANITNQKEIDHLFSETERVFGKLDILVNNAGFYEFAPLEKITIENFHKHFNLNVLGLLLACQTAVKHFNSAGGSIVNISSLASKSWAPYATVYSATKAAVDSITKSLGCELGSKNIRVNAINPGIVQMLCKLNLFYLFLRNITIIKIIPHVSL